jgi:hypothetical protein
MMNKLIMIVALAVLGYLILKWYKAKQAENATNVLPVDSVGVIVEPNNLTVADTMNDIQSLV